MKLFLLLFLKQVEPYCNGLKQYHNSSELSNLMDLSLVHWDHFVLLQIHYNSTPAGPPTSPDSAHTGSYYLHPITQSGPG